MKINTVSVLPRRRNKLKQHLKSTDKQTSSDFFHNSLCDRDEVVKHVYLVEDDDSSEIFIKPSFKQRLGKYIKPKTKWKGKGSKPKIGLGSHLLYGNGDSATEKATHGSPATLNTASPEGSPTYPTSDDESEQLRLLQVKVIEPESSKLSFENEKKEDDASNLINFEVVVDDGLCDDEEHSGVKGDTPKPECLTTKPKKLLPQECLHDIKSMENQVLIVNINEKTIHTHHNIKPNEKTISMKTIEEWCNSELNGIADFLTSFMRPRKETKLVKNSQDYCGSGTSPENGTELQYKTPTRKNLKQTTVVLPCQNQSYCEVLTASPDSATKYKPLEFNAFMTNHLNADQRITRLIEDHDASTKKQMFVTPKKLLRSKKPSKERHNDWFDSMVSNTNEHESVGDFFTVDSFALNEISKTNVIVQDATDSWFKDNNNFDPFTKEEKVKYNKEANDSLDEILSNFEDLNFTEVTAANVNVKKDAAGWKNGEDFSVRSCHIPVNMKSESEGEEIKPEISTFISDAPLTTTENLVKEDILSSDKDMSFTEVSATNLTIDKDTDGQNNVESSSVSSCQMVVNMNNMSVEKREPEIISSVNYTTTSSGFSNILLSETKEVIQTIENLVKHNIKSCSNDQRRDEDGESDDTFRGVLKSMVRDIVLGQSTFNNRLKETIFKEGDFDASTKSPIQSANKSTSSKKEFLLSKSSRQSFLPEKGLSSKTSIQSASDKTRVDPAQKGDNSGSIENPSHLALLKELKGKCSKGDNNVLSSPVKVVSFPSTKEKPKKRRDHANRVNNDSYGKGFSKVQDSPTVKGIPSISERIAALQKKLNK